MNEQLALLSQKDLDYPQSENEIYPPADNALSLLAAFAEQRKIEIPHQLKEFYTYCAEVSLPGIHNAYFIIRPELILRSLEPNFLVPTEIRGTINCKIITFGSDGSGNFFAMKVAQESNILYLPVEATIENCVYFSEDEPYGAKWLTEDFYSFLDRLLADTKASVSGDKNWEYMDHVIYGKR